MSNKFNILMIDDTLPELESCERAVKNFNNENIYFDFKGVKTYHEGLNELLTGKYHFLILDIKLSGIDEEGEGNKIFKIIDKNNLFICTRIVSATIPTHLDRYIEEKEENIYFKRFDRGDVNYSFLLKEFEEIALIGLVEILKNDGLLNKSLNKIINHHLTPVFKYWKENDFSNVDDKKVLRYIATHINEYLHLNDSGNFEKVENYEFYFFPPINKNFVTGDIIKEVSTDSKYVILNPSCDLIVRNNGKRKAKKALCCKLVRWGEIPFEASNMKETTSDDKKKKEKKLKEEKEKRIKNNYSLKYYFLPPTQVLRAKCVDFSDIFVFEFNELEDKTKFSRVASISPYFLKELIDRFSSFYSRKGQPDLDTKKVIKLIDEEL